MTITEMFFSLHVDHPGEVGGPPANELNYPEYARVAVTRSARGWTEGPLTFPPMRHGDLTLVAKYVAVSSRANDLLFSGTLYPHITVSKGVTPQVRDIAIEELAAMIEDELKRAPMPAPDRAALQAIRGVIADAVGHPARGAALRAIDRLGSR
jgi:hypothetical protein